jgi:curved DNA-binding protein CbpA
MKATLYQLFGVKPDAKQLDIDAAYLERTAKFKALCDKGDLEAPHQLLFLKDGYSILSDPARRDDYDNKLARAQHEAKLQATAEALRKSAINPTSVVSQSNQMGAGVTPVETSGFSDMKGDAYQTSTGKSWIGRGGAFAAKRKVALIGLSVLVIVAVSLTLPRYIAASALKKRGIEFTPQSFVSNADKPELVKLFLRAGMAPDARNNHGETALIRAASQGAIGSMRLLIEAGADIHAESKDELTPLSSILMVIHLQKTVKGLLALQGSESPSTKLANLEAEMEKQRPRNIEVMLPAVQLLLERGANPLRGKIGKSTIAEVLIQGDEKSGLDIVYDVVIEAMVNPRRLEKCQESSNLVTWTNCFGTIVFPGERKYIGEFKDGNPNGQGAVRLPDGSKYIGGFKDGKPNGRGTFDSDLSGTYVGEFKDGTFNGHGTFTMRDGTRYVGEFKDGKASGQGSYTSSFGQ